jgi:hypothetical protein
VPSWLRVRAANLLAADGESWVNTFKRHNSGTYNNQVCVCVRACVRACFCWCCHDEGKPLLTVPPRIAAPSRAQLTTHVQYMVVDLKRFKPRRQLEPGLLWVVEQLPGMVEAADLTSTLALGYWPR